MKYKDQREADRFERRVQDRLAALRQVRDLNEAIHKQQSFVHHYPTHKRDPFARNMPKSAAAIRRYNVVSDDGPRGAVDRLAGAGVRSNAPKQRRIPRALTIDTIKWALDNKYITIEDVKRMIK